MELVKNFLKTNVSASVSVLCSKLEIPYNALYPLLEPALIELGQSNYRIIYSLSANRKTILLTEKHKKELEELHGKQARIYSIQRVTEDINSLFNSEMQHKDQLVTDELKNGGLYLPLFSNLGGFLQDKREYNNQKKLNFRPKKVAPENKVKESKPEEIKTVQIAQPEFELEEEGIVRAPNEPIVMPFARIVDIDIQDMDDIMSSEIAGVRFIKEVRKRVVEESSEEEVAQAPVMEVEKKVEEPQKFVPKKRKGKFSENVEKKMFRESILPSVSIAKTKLMQPSLAAFFKK